MSEKDLKINQKVRKILTEYNLDLSVLNVSSASGAVTIRGEFRKLGVHELHDREIGNLLNVLETVIFRTKDVKRVTFYIKDWKKKKGRWHKGGYE